MFEQSLVISSRQPIRSQRQWSTAAAASLEALVLSVLAVYPLLHPAALPQITSPRAPAPIFSATQPEPAHTGASSQSNALVLTTESLLRQPTAIPPRIAPGSDVAPPSNVLPQCTINCMPNGILIGMGNALPPVAPPRPASKAIISKLDAGEILRRVEPAYPPLARTARIQGNVVLRAMISRSGEIENLQVISGHPMLVQAAIEAVRQWKFRPYLLNGSAVEVETQITVRFVLGQ